MATGNKIFKDWTLEGSEPPSEVELYGLIKQFGSGYDVIDGDKYEYINKQLAAIGRPTMENIGHNIPDTLHIFKYAGGMIKTDMMVKGETEMRGVYKKFYDTVQKVVADGVLDEFAMACILCKPTEIEYTPFYLTENYDTDKLISSDDLKKYGYVFNYYWQSDDTAHVWLNASPEYMNGQDITNSVNNTWLEPIYTPGYCPKLISEYKLLEQAQISDLYDAKCKKHSIFNAADTENICMPIVISLIDNDGRVITPYNSWRGTLENAYFKVNTLEDDTLTRLHLSQMSYDTQNPSPYWITDSALQKLCKEHGLDYELMPIIKDEAVPYSVKTKVMLLDENDGAEILCVCKTDEIIKDKDILQSISEMVRGEIPGLDLQLKNVLFKGTVQHLGAIDMETEVEQGTFLEAVDKSSKAAKKDSNDCLEIAHNNINSNIMANVKTRADVR